MPALTAEEIEEIDIRSDFTDKARTEIRRKHNTPLFMDYVDDPKYEQTGSIVCPMCGGKLDYSISSNGHIHGSCSKNEEERYSCLDWWE